MFCHCNGPWHIEVRKRLGYGAQAASLVVLMLACLRECLNFLLFFSLSENYHTSLVREVIRRVPRGSGVQHGRLVSGCANPASFSPVMTIALCGTHCPLAVAALLAISTQTWIVLNPHLHHQTRGCPNCRDLLMVRGDSVNL